MGHSWVSSGPVSDWGLDCADGAAQTMRLDGAVTPCDCACLYGVNHYG